MVSVMPPKVNVPPGSALLNDPTTGSMLSLLMMVKLCPRLGKKPRVGLRVAPAMATVPVTLSWRDVVEGATDDDRKSGWKPGVAASESVPLFSHGVKSTRLVVVTEAARD